MATTSQTMSVLQLRKQNPNLSREEAVRQVMSANKPVTPTANPPVTPPPTPTPQVENAPVAGVPPQPTPTPAPAPQAPVATQQTPTPTPTPTPVTPPPTTSVSSTKTPEQIKREEISAQNEAQMALNRQQAELRQQERDKATQEANNQLANDENAIYNTLSSGGVIPDVVKTSPFYKRAKNTFKQVQNFRTMSQAQLSNAISNGSILPGTEVYNKLIQDPAMAQRVKEARIYATPPNQDQILQDQSSKILSENSKVAQFLEDGILSMDEYNQMTNNSDVVAQAKLREEKLSTLNAFNKEWNDARDRIKREFAGSAFLDSMLADLDSGYKTRADYLQNEVDIATGTLTDLKATATSLFNANIDNYIAYRNAQIGVDTTRINTLTRNQAELAQNQALFEQQIAQQAQTMGTPELAIPSVINQYAQMGIMASVSPQEHVARANAFIAQGGTLGEYISQMQRDFQAKPEYLAKFAPASTQDWQKLTDTTLYNQKTGEIRNLSGTSGGLPSSFTGDTTSYIAAKEGFRSQAYQDSAGVWTIGYGTTRINGKPVQPGQTITQAEAQKLLEEDIARHSNWKNFIDETTLSPSQRTALASFEYNLGPGIWEKSAMNIIDMVKSGDLAGAGREMQKYTNAGGRFVQGLANRRAEEAQLLMNAGTRSEGVGTGVFKTDAIPKYENFLKTGKVGTNEAEFKNIIAEFGSEENFRRQAEAYNNQGPRLKELQKVESLRDKVSSLISDDKKEVLSNTVGTAQWTFPLTSERREKESYLATIQNLLSGQTLQQLIDAKAEGATFGALSNEELRMLQTAASPLAQLAIYDTEDPTRIVGFRGSEENFRDTIQAVVDKYNEVINQKMQQIGSVGVVSMPTQTFPTTQNTNTGVGQVINFQGYQLKPF